MNTNRVLSIMIATALVVTAVFVAQSTIETSIVNARAKDFLATNTDAARWQALGQYYAKQDAAHDFNPLSIREIAAERWEAMGQAYAKAVSPARQADLARWVGLGELYAKLSASTNAVFDAQRIRDNDAARLEALGQAYAKAVSPARQADLARWLTTQNCFSDLYHAATDCDRLASGATVIQVAALVRAGLPDTGAKQLGPSSVDCYSAKFHAASDCDRVASGK